MAEPHANELMRELAQTEPTNHPYCPHIMLLRSSGSRKYKIDSAKLTTTTAMQTDATEPYDVKNRNLNSSMVAFAALWHAFCHCE